MWFAIALGFLVAFFIACDGFIFVAGFIAGLAMWPDMWLLAMCEAGVEVAADAVRVAVATRKRVKIAFFMPLVRNPDRAG